MSAPESVSSVTVGIDLGSWDELAEALSSVPMATVYIVPCSEKVMINAEK